MDMATSPLTSFLGNEGGGGTGGEGEKRGMQRETGEWGSRIKINTRIHKIINKYIRFKHKNEEQKKREE